MGTNTLTTVSDGDLILAAHHNELLQALRQDLVPRNNSDVPEDIFGQLGTSALRWLRAYVQEYRIGDAANNLRIYEPSSGIIRLEQSANNYVEILGDELRVFANGTQQFRVTSTGIDWATQANDSIPLGKVNGFVFHSRTTTNHSFNDTNNLLLQTTTGPSLVFVEIVSGIDFAGVGNSFSIIAKDIVGSPTSRNGDIEIFKWEWTGINSGLNGIQPSHPGVIPAGKEIRVFNDGGYTAIINLHVLRLF